jgi:hypothetical protein
MQQNQREGVTMKSLINTILRKTGYELNNVSRVREERNGWAQYKFVRPDGSFDYEQYRRLQNMQSKKSVEKVWASEENIEFLAGYLKGRLDKVKFGLCHGTKRGMEQQWFMKHLGPGALVDGTEIADWAKNFQNTIQWDFHEVKPEWRDACDFIYSNALDHSYDPEKAVRAWMSCVKPGGFCFVEWNVYGEPLNITDPFSADLVQLVYAVTKWGDGKFWVRHLIPSRTNPEYINFVVIEKG